MDEEFEDLKRHIKENGKRVTEKVDAIFFVCAQALCPVCVNDDAVCHLRCVRRALADGEMTGRRPKWTRPRKICCK